MRRGLLESTNAMEKQVMRTMLALLSIIAVTGAARADEPSAVLVRSLLAKAGLTHGIASLPRCDDGAQRWQWPKTARC